MAATEPWVVYRTTAQRRGIIGTVVVHTALWAVGIGQVASGEGPAGWTRRVIGIFLILAFLAVTVWFGGIRCAGAGVLAGARDVIVRNPLRSHRVPWDAIEAFTVEPAWVGTQGYLHTRDGDWIPIFGIQGPNPGVFPNSRWAEQPISDLNKLLAERRTRTLDS